MRMYDSLPKDYPIGDVLINHTSILAVADSH